MGDAYTANTLCSHSSYLLKIKFNKKSIIMYTKTEGKFLYKRCSNQSRSQTI